MGESGVKQPRGASGRFEHKLYRSPRGRMVPASGRNEAERDETRRLLIDLVNTPTDGRSEREVNALLIIGEAFAMEVEEDFAQIQAEKQASERLKNKR